MGHHLDDARPGRDELALEGVDLGVALRPLRPRHQVVDADDEDVFVVRAVEDADLSRSRQGAADAPEELVPPLLGSRGLERRRPNAFRVNLAHDVTHQATLA